MLFRHCPTVSGVQFREYPSLAYYLEGIALYQAVLSDRFEVGLRSFEVFTLQVHLAGILRFNRGHLAHASPNDDRVAVSEGRMVAKINMQNRRHVSRMFNIAIRES